MNTNQQMADYYQALADGKTLEGFTNGKWTDVLEINPILNILCKYRIEPEVLYINKLLSGERQNYNSAPTAVSNAKIYEYIAKRFTADE